MDQCKECGKSAKVRVVYAPNYETPYCSFCLYLHDPTAFGLYSYSDIDRNFFIFYPLPRELTS